MVKLIIKIQKIYGINANEYTFTRILEILEFSTQSKTWLGTSKIDKIKNDGMKTTRKFKSTKWEDKPTLGKTINHR